MTLSLINSNKDFDLNLLVKLHYVKEITHMMLVAFWRW